jgi:hypothetical protein
MNECLATAENETPIRKKKPYSILLITKMPAIASTEHLPGKMVWLRTPKKTKSRFGTTVQNTKKLHIADRSDLLLFPLYNKSKIEIKEAI